MDRNIKTKEKNYENNFLIRFAVFVSDKIVKLNNKVESIHGRWLEIGSLLLYGILHIVMAIFHEPWYDEAVAWQIARCASIKKIIFEIPHYEGHPPLWHLILSIFAQNNAPYELSLTLISLVFTLAAVWMILFKSPFPRLMKLLFPFTYFIFYQYGVISRPYCMMMLAMMLLAYFYKTRNEKPFAYVFSMVFLCLTSAYGILIAGSIAFIWVCEIVSASCLFGSKRKNSESFVKKIIKIFKDRRTWLLICLLFFAICLCIEIMPREDTSAIKIKSIPVEENSIILRLLYTLVLMPADAVYTNVYSRDVFLRYFSFDPTIVVFVLLFSCVFFVTVYMWGKKRKTLWIYVLPHTVVGVFFACVYGALHHTGIELLIILFWLWITWESGQMEDHELLLTDNKLKVTKLQPLKIESVFLICFCMGMSLYWSICSCRTEIKEDYSIGRNEAAFIKKNNLDQYNIMLSWTVVFENDERIYIDTNNQNVSDEILPYFDHNIFYTVQNGDDSLAYSTHKVASPEENEEAKRLWKEKGMPDVIIGVPDMKWVFGDEFSENEYIPVLNRYKYMTWKDDYSVRSVIIFVRKDLADKLGLKEVKTPNYIKGHIFDQTLGEN